MAPTAKVVDELCIVKENLDSILSDISETVALLKKKEQAVSKTRDKVEEVCQLLRGDSELLGLRKTTESETELRSVEEEQTKGDVTLLEFYNNAPGLGHLSHTDIPAEYVDLQKGRFSLDADVTTKEQSLETARNCSKFHHTSQIEQKFDASVDESKIGVKKKQNVVEYIAKVESDQEEVLSDCDSVVSVRPTVKRSPVPSGGLGVARKGETRVTQPPENEGYNGTNYVDYHDPGEELFLWEMPPENERGHRRDPVELTDMQNLYLLGPGARGMERVSTRARVALRMRVHKGRNGVLVYGTAEAIDKAKDMLSQITKHVVKEIDVSSIIGHQGVKGRLLSSNAGVVVQVVQGEHGQGRVVELVGLPAGIKKARKMIQDPML